MHKSARGARREKASGVFLVFSSNEIHKIGARSAPRKALLFLEVSGDLDSSSGCRADSKCLPMQSVEGCAT